MSAFAPILANLSIHGRTKVANFLILSIPRYWVQTLATPQSFHRALKSSVDRVLWTNHRTGRKLQWIKHPELPLKGDTEEGPHLGLGLLDWNNHVKALQAKWILNYLDARQAQWKQVLDAWFCRTSLGRAAVLAEVPAHKLIDGIKGRSRIPVFWKQALANARALQLTRLKLSRDGALSQPIWCNPNHRGPSMHPRWAELWSKLECNAIHNVFKDHACVNAFTADECEQYLKNNDTYIRYKGEYIPRDRFLGTWDNIVRKTRDRPKRDGDTRGNKHAKATLADPHAT